MPIINDDASVTSDHLKSIIFYDPITGCFSWVSSDRYHKNPPGYECPKGYRRIKIGNRQVFAHRLAWLYFYGEWPSEMIDHIDGNPSNNAISNLRLATSQINSQNQKKGYGQSGFLGVTVRNRNGIIKYRASIRHNGKLIQLGSYDSAEDAHAVYLVKKAEIHQGNTLPAPSKTVERKSRMSGTGHRNISVSYTHLTLPTNREV